MKLKSFVVFTIYVSSCFFGIALAEPPQGYVDVIQYQNGRLHVDGWAADSKNGAPVKNVQVFLDNKLFRNAKLGLNRSDVSVNMKRPDWIKSGWVISEKIKLTKGIHKIKVYAINKNNEKNLLINKKIFQVR